MNTQAQSLPVPDLAIQDYLRIRQLEGKTDSSLSLNIRPVKASFLNQEKDSSGFKYLPKNLHRESSLLQFKILPVSLVQQLNTQQPYGWNDGLMIPAKGYQVLFSAGVFAKFGPLSIQLKPEFVYAANPVYLEGNDRIAAESYSSFITGANVYGADIPAYFEGKGYTSAGLGQSNVRLSFGPASLGISNENLWWGPGRKNSLLMSSSARGFKHISLNTNRPVKTPIGFFEGQIISGRLENSNSPLNDLKIKEWRYLSGLSFSYSPRWVPGLFFGLTRVFQIYNTDLKTAGDYFPLFQAFEKKRTNEDYKNRDQLSSVFARLILPEANAELYVEFGRNDHSVDIRDFTMEPNHSRAYLAGFQKLISLTKPAEKLLISAEIAQLSQPPSRFVRGAGNWYVHKINQGYTNEGEVLGAGIGPGGNIQTLEISWLKDFKKIGIQFERFVHNNDYYQAFSSGSRDLNGQWVDLSAGFLFNRNYENILLSGKILGVQSLNYLWQSGEFGTSKRNVFNVHANLGLSYYFK